MSDRLPDRMPEHMSDRMPEYLPDRMSEYMSDKLSEYIEHMSKSRFHKVKYNCLSIYLYIHTNTYFQLDGSIHQLWNVFNFF